jgi:hypothetical protein
MQTAKVKVYFLLAPIFVMPMKRVVLLFALINVYSMIYKISIWMELLNEQDHSAHARATLFPCILLH